MSDPLKCVVCGKYEDMAVHRLTYKIDHHTFLAPSAPASPGEWVCAMDGLTSEEHKARGLDTDTDEHGPWRPRAASPVAEPDDLTDVELVTIEGRRLSEWTVPLLHSTVERLCRALRRARGTKHDAPPCKGGKCDEARCTADQANSADGCLPEKA